MNQLIINKDNLHNLKIIWKVQKGYFNDERFSTSYNKGVIFENHNEALNEYKKTNFEKEKNEYVALYKIAKYKDDELFEYLEKMKY